MSPVPTALLSAIPSYRIDALFYFLIFYWILIIRYSVLDILKMLYFHVFHGPMCLFSRSFYKGESLYLYII